MLLSVSVCSKPRTRFASLDCAPVKRLGLAIPSLGLIHPGEIVHA